MTKATDSVRILLKAYGDELSLEQIKKLLATKDDITSSVSELVSEKIIEEVSPNTYKISDTTRPKFFYVFQKKSYMKEFNTECIFCSYSPDSKPIAHWDSIEEVQAGDIVLHECDGSIYAVSEAKGHVYDADRPYSYTDGNIDHGRKVDLSYVWLKSQIDRKSDKFEQLRKDLYESQPEKVAPFDKNGKGNEGYLFYFNDVCAKMIFSEMLKQR